MRYVVEDYGHSYIAHRDDGHDCANDDLSAYHGVSDHPVAALRALLKNVDVSVTSTERGKK